MRSFFHDFSCGLGFFFFSYFFLFCLIVIIKQKTKDACKDQMLLFSYIQLHIIREHDNWVDLKAFVLLSPFSHQNPWESNESGTDLKHTLYIWISLLTTHCTRSKYILICLSTIWVARKKTRRKQRLLNTDILYSSNVTNQLSVWFLCPKLIWKH